MARRKLPLELKYRLKNREVACRYLQQSYDLTLDPSANNETKNKVFLEAVGDILYSTGKPVEYLSRKAGITKSHCYRIIKGEKNPTLNTLRALLHQAGISLSFKPTDE